MAENNIIIKITSEADLDNAQKALQDMVHRGEELEQQFADVSREAKADADAIKKAAKAGEAGLQTEKELAESLRASADYYKKKREALKDEREEVRRSVKELDKQIKSYQTLNGISGKAVQQLRAMRERLMEMEDAGEFGTEAFVNLSIAAANLEDQIGDTQQRIRFLASDTKELDAAIGLGDGLAGSFYIATSAAELFGDDLEGLQKAFYKVQSVMAIVNGLQQVSNALNKDSNVNVVLSAALKKLQVKASMQHAAALGKETIAQRILNRVMASNPAAILLTAIGALVAVYTTLSEVLSRVGDRQARLNKLQTENKISELQSYYSLRTSLMQSYGDTALEVAKVEETAAKEELQIREDAVARAQKLYDESNTFNRSKRKEDLDEALENVKEARKQLLAAQDRTLVEMANQRISYTKEANQTEVSLMREGERKEIEQIKLNYAERLKTLTDGSEETLRLRKLLERQQAKEIAKVRRQYALQAQQTEIQNQKNLLTKLQQTRIDEADIEKEIALTKKIAEAEAQARIDALDKEVLGLKEYEAQRKAIELELANTLRDIDEQEVQRLNENAKRRTEIIVQEAENRKNALTGAEGVDEQLKALDDFYAARKKQLEENAEMERQAVQRSTDTEEVKEAKIKQIDANLQREITDLTKEGEQERINVYSQSLTALEIEADKAARAVEQAQTTGGKLSALKANLDAQMALYKGQEEELERLWDGGSKKALISHDEYLKRRWELTKAAIDAETQYQQDKMQTIADVFEFALNQIQQVSDLAFEAINQNIQAEMDALDEQYTTDWEEAQKNADKKYITEKEYEKKKAALEMKQAKFAKAQALTNIAIQTALAVMNAMATAPFPLNVAMAALAGSMGVAQLAVAASKPLAQYEKGRKGGKGEYALVGEKGAEIMYVPQGASIIPHNKIADQAAWADYGVPKLAIPPLPTTDLETTKYIRNTIDNRLTIDYDKLGEAVARNMPKPQAVTVNVDRSGVQVNDGFGSHTYLNRKYAGSWN